MKPEDLYALAKHLVVEYLRVPPEYSFVYDLNLSDEDSIYVHDRMTEILDDLADQV